LSFRWLNCHAKSLLAPVGLNVPTDAELDGAADEDAMADRLCCTNNVTKFKTENKNKTEENKGESLKLTKEKQRSSKTEKNKNLTEEMKAKMKKKPETKA
jgi:hypothetical protein